MSDSDRFTALLHSWAEVFMRRSMHDFVKFSKDSGVSMPQLSTLMRLYHQGACGVSDIGSHLGVTNAAASQMIDRLVQQGLLERSEDPKDRRGKHIQVTPKGRQLIEDGIEARRRWMEELTTELTAEEQVLIVHALILLTRAARQLEPGVPTADANKENAIVQPIYTQSGS
jgi:DNA-binding MarR family transcriptional regulator